MSTTIKFNAGKIHYDEDTKKCTPLPHKGQITIGPSADDEGFLDFVWTPKSNSGVEKDELLIIPGDMTFKPVTSCTSGRVCALTFLCSGDKNLYWLQDVGDDDELGKWTEKDLELLKAVQNIITPADEDGHTEPKSAVEITTPEILTGDEVFDEYDHFPVLSISDILREDLIQKHLDTLSKEELVEHYGDILPEATEPTKEEIMQVVQSEFFRKASAELSSNFNENGMGQLMSRSYGYTYPGEGLDAFLRGIRSIKKKRERAEKRSRGES